jgi:excisionase family DNA binding protein
VQRKEYLTTEDIARHLDISVATVRRYIRTGKLAAVRLEREYRVRREDFEKFLKEREIGTE